MMNVAREPSGSYRYKGIRLSPSIVVELTKELFAGQLVERQANVEAVRNLHARRGGSPPKVSDFSNTVKKALANMQKAGEAENPSPGYRKILPKDTEVIPQHATDDVSSEKSEEVTDAQDESLAERILGTGDTSVYLYYLPTYRNRAQERGEVRWQCTIGRTDGKAEQRIVGQAGTALPEKPVLAVVFRTKYAVALERAFHSVLTLRGLAVQDVPGTEWFLTSPDEVIALAKAFDPASFNTEKDRNARRS
jgi:hypothetical protein